MKKYIIIECLNRESPKWDSGLYFYFRNGDNDSGPEINIIDGNFDNPRQASERAYLLAKSREQEYKMLNDECNGVKPGYAFIAGTDTIDSTVSIFETQEVDGEIVPLNELDWCCVYRVRQIDI